ncbi:MAG: hypothetical protein QNJ90_09370 [Planctomycetota bacterium]|nr:hypothetical protein [Planctomycetota bacterium]
MGADGAQTKEQEPAVGDSPARPRLRVTGIAGAVAALCVGLSFFLPWATVAPEHAQQFEAAVTKSIDERATPPAGGEDFRTLARTMVAEGALTGADFIHWVRTAKTFSAELDASANPGVDAGAHVRRLELVRVLLYGIPIAAFLLAAHFVFHRFRRARFPVLVLCILVGGASVVLAGTLQFAHGFMAQALPGGARGGSLAIGWNVLLVGGAVLGLAGFFGVSARNWFRTYVVSAITAAGLAFLALRYLETGGLT